MQAGQGRGKHPEEVTAGHQGGRGTQAIVESGGHHCGAVGDGARPGIARQHPGEIRQWRRPRGQGDTTEHGHHARPAAHDAQQRGSHPGLGGGGQERGDAEPRR